MGYRKHIPGSQFVTASLSPGAVALVLMTPLLLVTPTSSHAQSATGKAQKQAQPARQGAPSPVVPPDFGTPQGTARIAKSAGFLDVVGIKPGMGMKEALSALNSHRSDLIVQPLKLGGYEPSPGVSVTPVVMAQADTRRSKTIEKISLEFTYSPSDSYLWSVTRDIGFVQGEAPTRDTILADLRKKYGPESFMQQGSYRPVWLFDAQGKPVAGQGATDIYNKCLALWTGGGMGAWNSLYSPVNDNQVVGRYDKQLKGGYYYSSYGKDPSGGHCHSYTVVQVAMNQGLQIRLTNRQLEASGVQAAHTQMAQAAAELEKKRAGEAAKRGAPKL